MTPSSSMRAVSSSEKTWKPPESVRIGRSQAMKRCRPPSSAISSSPGRRCRWYVLPSTICAPTALELVRVERLDRRLRADRHEHRRPHGAVRRPEHAGAGGAVRLADLEVVWRSSVATATAWGIVRDRPPPRRAAADASRTPTPLIEDLVLRDTRPACQVHGVCSSDGPAAGGRWNATRAQEHMLFVGECAHVSFTVPIPHGYPGPHHGCATSSCRKCKSCARRRGDGRLRPAQSTSIASPNE